MSRSGHSLTARNNFGFAAQHDFMWNPNAVALVGDSFVEASMLALNDRPAAQLEAALQGRREVYALGSPGTALLDYAERIRFAHDHFGTRDFVVLMERGDVMQALCGSGNIHAQCLDRKTLEPRVLRLPDPGLAKRILRESALAQYVFSQLKVSTDRLWEQAVAQSRPVSVSPSPARAPADSSAAAHARPAPMREVDEISRVFFERIKPYVSGKLILVVDSDRVRIERGEPPSDPIREHFIDLARAAGAVVVDSEPLFIAHGVESPLALEVGPYDAHMNSLAIGIVMGAAARALRGATHAAEDGS